LQQKAIRSVNDILVFAKGHTDLLIPLDEVVTIFLQSNHVLQRNVTLIFVKLGLSRGRPASEVGSLQKLIDSFRKIPAASQTMVLESYIRCHSAIDPSTFIQTLYEHKDVVLKIEPSSLVFMPSFVQQNGALFANFEDLFVQLVLRFDISVSLPGSLDGERIVKVIDSVWNTADAQTMNLCLLLLSQVKFPFQIEKIISQTSHSNVFRCLDAQLSLASPESVLPHTSQLSSVLASHLTNAHAASAMRGLLRKCPDRFKTNLPLFQDIFGADMDTTTRNALLTLFSSFIQPTNALFRFLENQAYSGEVIVLQLLSLIFPFNDPRPPVLACTLIGDPNFCEECRILLSPHKLIVHGQFRRLVPDSDAKYPTTSDLFDTVIASAKIRNFLLDF
jgi:hypothetical protein